jgi:hypothetical protein
MSKQWNRTAREATDRAIDPWLVGVLGSVEHEQIGFTQFSRRYEEAFESGMPELKEAWNVLRQISGDGPQRISLRRLVENLRNGFVPDELNYVPTTTLVVSTVHRSKGREFDRVVIVDDIYDERQGEDIAEETRLLFVAATRPRWDLLTAASPHVVGRVLRNKWGRWVRHGWKWSKFGIEVQGGDLRRIDPPGTAIAIGDPVAIQKHIATNVHSGDLLRFELLGKAKPSEGPTSYSVYHGDTLVGVTDEGFGTALLNEIGASNSQWPVAIDEIRVDCVETVPGTPAASKNANLGNCGLWLGVRPAGLGSLKWGKE